MHEMSEVQEAAEVQMAAEVIENSGGTIPENVSTAAIPGTSSPNARFSKLNSGRDTRRTLLPRRRHQQRATMRNQLMMTRRTKKE